MTTITITYFNGQVESFDFPTHLAAMRSFIERQQAADMLPEAIVENGQVIGWSAGGRGYDFTMELL
jgi:hypothetical protein